MSDIQQQDRARERTNVMQSILKGKDLEGAAAELEKTSMEAEAQLKQKARMGSKPAGHAADVLEAQRLLVTEKNLGERFARIATNLEKLRGTSGPNSDAVRRLQSEMEALRPLLRLTLRSDQFRKVLISALRIAKHVVEEHSEGDAEIVMDKGEKQGVKEAANEAQRQVQKTVEKIGDKIDRGEDVINDRDWEKLSSELDSLFQQLQSHGEFRQAVEQLFSLASSVTSQIQNKADSSCRQCDEIRHEAEDLVAQFSGEKELHELIHSIQSLAKEVDNSEAHAWWADFKRHVMHVTQNYQGKQDIEEFRDIFHRGYQIFKKQRPQVNEIIDRMNIVMENISNDKMVARLRESLAALSDDLYWTDSNGNRYFDTEAAGMLASSISDVIKNQFKYLALPRVVRTEGDVAYALDNLVISATLPDRIDFHLESFASLDTGSTTGALQTEIYLTATIRGITVEAPNVAFNYRGTTLSDSGLMSIRIPEPGASLSIDFVLRPMGKPEISAATAPTSFATTTGMEKGGVIGTVGGGFMKYEFLRLKAHFSVPDMQIDFDKKTLTHSVLVPMMTTLFKARIVDKVESGIEEALDKGLINLGQQVTSVLNQAPNPLSLSSFGSMMSTITPIH